MKGFYNPKLIINNLFMKKLIQFWCRFYSDFIMQNRFNEFWLLLQEAINRGYKTWTIRDFYEKIRSGSIEEGEKYLILRHDSDTDIAIAKIIWQIEQELQVNGSYYFRLSTLDIPFVQRIADAGGEASYHYEELATLAKEKGLKDKSGVEKFLPYIREIFKNNLCLLRKNTGLPMKTVASHGDFINRRLGITNTVILDSEDFRKQMGIELEVYDEKFMRFVSSRFSDTHYPVFWKPSHPLEAIKRGDAVIYILIHPRQKKANIPVNIKDNINRIWEDVRYRVKRLISK